MKSHTGGEAETQVSTVKSPVHLTDAETDEVLLQAVANGDHEALESLWLHYAEHMLCYLSALGTPAQDAESICQNIFLDIWRRPGHWRGKGLLKPWLMARCHSEWLKKQHLSQTQPTQPHLLHESLPELSRELHSVLMLTEVAGLKYFQVAEALAIPVAEVRQRKVQARRHLIEALEGMDSAEQPILGEEDFAALSDYTDGESAEQSSFALTDKHLLWHNRMMDVRKALLETAPVRVLVPSFENIERQILRQKHQRTSRRARLALELFGLAVAVALAAAAYVASHEDLRNSIQYRFHKLGWAKTLPPLPQDRAGIAVAWMQLEGRATITDSGGRHASVLAESATVYADENIEMADDASAVFVFPDGSQFVAKGGSQLRWHAPDNQSGLIQCTLDKGALWCSLVASEDKMLLKADGATLGAMSGEFEVSMGPESDLEKNYTAGRSRRVIGTSELSPASAPAAADSQAVRVTVVSGSVSAGGDADAMTGETLFVKSGVATVADTPFGDGSSKWAETAVKSARYEAVQALSQQIQMLRGHFAKTNALSIEEAVEPFRKLWVMANAKQIAEGADNDTLQQLGALRIRSTREGKAAVMIEVQSDTDARRSQFVMEKQGEKWTLSRQIGQILKDAQLKEKKPGKMIPATPFNLPLPPIKPI